MNEFMIELMIFLGDPAILNIFILFWALCGGVYFICIDHYERFEKDNIFGCIMMFFLAGPATWVILVTLLIIYGLLDIFRMKQIDEITRYFFRK